MDGSFMQHDMNMGGPNSQLPPVHSASMAAAADPAVQALLERLHQLENYKTHLENENKQMHQQLQVLSGFLNVVSTSVRTTENMLFSSVPANEPPHMQMQAEGSQMLSAVPSQSTVTAVAAGPVQAQTPTPTGMPQQQQQQQQPPMLGSNGHPSVYNAPQPTAAAGQASAQQQPQQHQQHPQQQQSAVAAAGNEAQQAAAAAAGNSGQAADGGNSGGATTAAAAAGGKDTTTNTAVGSRRRSSQVELATMDGSTAAAAAAVGATGSRKRARAEPPPSPSLPMPAAANSSQAALAAAVAAAANYMPTPQQQQQLAQMQQMQQFIPLGLGGSEITLRLTKVQGKTVLHSDPVMIYRVELSRNGVFEKYLFLPNDAIPIYGMRTWQHRDAIPQELLKMVENCLTTKAVASEQYIEEIKTMKAYMLQQCPHLARWGLGSNKVRLVTDSGMRDLVNRLHRTMQKHGTVVLPKQLEVDLGWITSPDLLQLPVQAWAAPVYSRRLQNASDDPYGAGGLAGPYGVSVVAAAAAGSSSGMGPTDNSPSASGLAGDMYQQQQMVPCGLPNMMPVMMHGNQQQQYNSNQLYYTGQQDMTMQQHGMLQQQGLALTLQQQQQALQHSAALGGPNISTGITLTNVIGRQGSTAADQGLGANGYAPVTPSALGPGPLDGLHHGQGSRTDLQGPLLHHGSSTASAAAAAADAVMPATAVDPAAMASMPVMPQQQQQQQKDAHQGSAAEAKQQQQQPAQQQRQHAAAAVSPVNHHPQQQLQQTSPGAAGSNGSTDSTMADAVAGLQALSRQQEESLQASRLQQHQRGAGKTATDVQPLRDQQQQPGSQPSQQQQQQDPTGSRQGSAPSPDAAAAAMCTAAPAAAATAIAVQQ